MDSEWRRLHPATILSVALRRIPQTIVGLVFVFGGGFQDGAWELVQLAFGVVALAPPAIVYFTGRYRLTDEQVEWRSGLLSTRRYGLPRERIQSVESSIDLVGRAFGLETLTISSAGGDGEIEIGLIDRRTAHELRAELSPTTIAAPPPGGRTEQPQPGIEAPVRPGSRRTIATLSRADLPRVIGVRATELVAALVLGLAVAAGAVIAWSQFGREALWAIIGFPVPVLVWGVTALASAIVTISFKSALYPDRIRTSKGIVGKVTTDVPLARVQGLQIKQTLMARRMGIEEISADNADASGLGALAGVLVHPLAPVGSWQQLATEVFGVELTVPAELQPIAPPSRRRRWIRAAAASVLVAGMVFVLGAAGLDAGLTQTAVVVPALAIWFSATACFGAIAELSFRNSAWAVNEQLAIFRRGPLTTTKTVLYRERVQAVEVTSTWFQRRLGLASIVIDSASPSTVARGVDLWATDTDQLALDVLFTASDSGGV